MNKPIDESASLKPVLGLFSATCVVVGAIIGIGIFFTPSNVALLAGSQPIAMWTWVIGGFIAMAGALTFAELGGMYPRTGGQYEILRDAWTTPVAFAYVFCNATLIQTGAIAIIAWYASLNLGIALTGELPGKAFIISMASGMIVVLTVTNYIGVRYGSSVQNATVISKVATLILIGAVALFAAAPAPVELAPEKSEAIRKASESHWAMLVFAGLVPVFFSLGGWQHALWIGGEVRDSRRNTPIAIILGVAIVTVVYLLANWAYFRLLGYEGVCNSGALAADAVAAVWPTFGKRLVAAAIGVSAIGVLNAQLLSGPRLLCGMAMDGKFFRPFARISPQSRTPWVSIFFLGGLGLAILLIFADADKIDKLLTSVVLVDCVFFALTGLAIFRLRKSRGTQDSYRSPLYPLFPVIFVAGETLILVMAFLNPKYVSGIWLVVAWIAIAFACYAVFFSGRSSLRPGQK